VKYSPQPTPHHARRQAAPAPFHVQPACAAGAGSARLGLERPRTGAYFTSSR
jgi:hypothetical protein